MNWPLELIGNMQFNQIIKKALVVKRKYALSQKKSGAKEWTREQLMEGFVGDVGDLMKLVMAKDGLRKIENVDEKLAHELSDCLWSVIVLADSYKIDLEKSFQKTMNELQKRLDD